MEEIKTLKEVLTNEDRVAYKLLSEAGLIVDESENICLRCGYEGDLNRCMNCGARFKCLD